MPVRFFVSYARHLRAVVRPIVDQLRDAGFEVWWDVDILEGADWWSTILDHVEWCNVFLFIVSEKSVISPYCLAELKYATDRNRPILPFVIDDPTRYTLPPEVTPMRNQWFLYDGDPARTLQRISDATKQVNWDRFRDIHAARPIEPGKGAGSIVREFQQAVTLAESGHFEEAIKHFRNVASLDFDGWGEDCQNWLARLPRYAEIAELAEHKATYRRASKSWAEYLQTYDAEFDPLDVQGKLAKVNLTTPAVVAEQAPRITLPASPPRPTKPSSLDLMPKPFAWIKIPAGKVTLSTNETFAVADFSIAKYPLTNAQFAKFIEAKGYQRKEWWTEEGWQAKESQGWAEPRFWQDDQWNKADYPVVGVSWFEAVAFCLWLSNTTEEAILLPTEQQWQRAAQGDSNHAYPWGDKFDRNLCNVNTQGTTPVTQYEGKGDSPFKVADMAGNVWEWCLTDYETGKQDHTISAKNRVLRGGSWWNNYVNDLRADYRSRITPFNWFNYGGFRLARS